MCDECDRYRLALESLTPGGSEYYKNPEHCADFVNTIRQNQHKKILEEVKRRKKAEERIEELERALINIASDMEKVYQLINIVKGQIYNDYC